jgi:hypothetical protein
MLRITGKESVVAQQSRLFPVLLSIATLPMSNLMAAPAVTSAFASESGGYEISNAFSIDPLNHSVVSPPQGARAGDLLWIRPLRLNADEYLVLQRCKSADCSDATVVRAWNAYGAMGPLPILSNKVRIEAGATYMIWMQRIVIRGGGTFPTFQSASARLVFVPSGPQRLFAAADLSAARQAGPTPIAKASEESRSFVATFQGGSVVRMQMLRAAGETAAH